MKALLEQLSQNELRIFRAIYEKGPVSRVRISEGLNLTRAAVTTNTKQLIQLRLIVEVGKGGSNEKPGRREILLSVNPDAGCFLAVHVSLSQINFGLVNLTGLVIEKACHYFNQATEPKEMLDGIADEIEEMFSTLKSNESRILGIGVAAPGIINTKTGIVLEKSHPGWTGFNIRQYFEEKFSLKTLIENDVKTLTLGEYHFGTGRRVNDLVCLWLKHGIGAGIITDGRLLRGHSSSAGEIGFAEFILDMPTKKSILISGRPKYWGDILSFSNIQETISRGVKEGWKTSLRNNSTINDFANAVNTNDPLGIYIFKLYSKILGTIVCNLIYAYNPKMLILAGPLIALIPNLTAEVKHHLEMGTLRTPLDNLDLKRSVLGEDGILAGCVITHLETIFKASENAVMKN